MYKVLKEKGNNSSVTLENTETKANIIIGRLTMDILTILEEEPHISFGEHGTLSLKEKWEIEVSDETAKKLSSKAFRMSKPVRDQRKTKEDQLKKSNKEIDAMDVLLGLASYN